MDILVIGGGGREHAIVKKLKESKKAEKITALKVKDIEVEMVKSEHDKISFLSYFFISGLYYAD